MALGGVDTGIIKPSDDDRAIPTATGMGLNPIETAVLIAMEPIRLMAAVCEVNSANIRVMIQKILTKNHSEGVLPSNSLMPPPTQSDRPVV